MIKNIFMMVGLVFLLGLTKAAPAQVSPTMYTLNDIYYYLIDGTPATGGGHSLEPSSGAVPGVSGFKTLSQIYQDTKARFDQCDTTAADVAYGKVFFSVKEGSWGVRIGRAPFVMVTGQTVSYRTGDDGYYQAGRPYNYTDNEDGTITDNATGLMWAKDGNGAGCRFGAQTDWDITIDWAENLIFATYSDWRVPNCEELYSISLTDATIGEPFINHTMFPNSAYSYWSSTSWPRNTNYALRVHFSNGYVTQRAKTYTNYVRVVRRGE